MHAHPPLPASIAPPAIRLHGPAPGGKRRGTIAPAAAGLAPVTAPDERPAPGRGRFLALMALAVVLSLTTWFSATAIAAELRHAWGLSPGAAGWLTNAVQLGFVAGALASSLVNLADVVRLNRLMAAAATLAAAVNLVPLLDPGAGGAIAARFVTGVALAGVYPPALKLTATWFRRGRGLALGLLIGALTLGSSLPHLVRALGGGLDWRLVVLVTSAASLVAAAIFAGAIREGPYPFARATMDLRQVGAVFRNRPLMLASLGYFGHMWELYAMWGWFLAFATAAGETGDAALAGRASLLTFAVVAAENCAESPTIATPQTSATATKAQFGPSKTKPIARAQDPETRRSPAVVSVRPMRSDSQPPSRHPGIPAATTAKVSSEARPARAASPVSPAAVAKARNQPHIA